MASITLIATPEQLNKMAKYYADYLLNPVPYSQFRAKKNGVMITGYTSGKVLFQGNQIEDEVAIWQPSNSPATPQLKKETSASQLPKDFANWSIIGSDEVGNGSYFGSLVVASCFVPTGRIALMQELGVKDSKALSDTQIIDLAEQIKLCVPHHITNCPPLKYNEAIITRNANSIKVTLHNFTLQKLRAKMTSTEHQQLQGTLIDQFTSPKNYYNYLRNEANPYTDHLYFAEKGESIHIAVACASILARAAFLESLVTLGKPFNTVLPSGAGSNVDQFGKKLVTQYGTNVLDQTAKLHFANTKKILG